MIPPVTPANDIERAGQWVLSLMLAVLIGLTFLLAWSAPPITVFALPLGILAVIGMIVVLLRPVAGASATLLFAILLMGYGEGLSIGSILFAGYTTLFLAYWYATRLLQGETLIRSWTDVLILVLIVGGLGGGAVLGLAAGADVGMLIGELRSFGMLALYFPIREVVRSQTEGARAILSCFLALGTSVALWNMYNMWQAFQSADVLWKIIDVRTAYGESALAVSLLFSVSLVYVADTTRSKLMLALLSSVLLVGLLLTKSRGYWIATLIGMVVVFGALRRDERSQLARTLLLIVVAVCLVAVVGFGDYLALIAAGIGKRFLTLGSAGTTDVSLINRFYESEAAWRLIQENPILGYGFGVPFKRFDIISKTTTNWSFLHNGYVAMWLKLGVWGVVSVLFVWGMSGIHAVRAARARGLSLLERAFGATAAGALVTLAIAANTSNPWALADQTLVVTVAFAVANGLAQRAGR